ncbi:MAG: ABC transporter substrate-binding protein [Ardenticatenaceae bacterium]|nr:ABC transporter substrate-binding protein [Ardenticatenaceae bacterium]
MRKLPLFVTIIVVLSLLLAACSQTETVTPEATEPEEVTQPDEAAQTSEEATEAPEAEPTQIIATPAPEATAVPDAKFNESPMLADKVSAGELPPVDDRLPENPRVIDSLSGEEGIYGGEMRVGFVGTSPEWGAFLWVAAWEHLVSWAPDANSIEYNLAENIEVNDDATEYTIHLRKGLRWSDGEPYTADDIMFYIDDVLMNTDISPDGPIADWLPSGMAADFHAEKIDDYTVLFSFPSPYGTFLYNLAGWQGRYFSMYPKHYLQTFHQTYNENVDELVAADGTVTDWIALFFKKGPDTWGSPSRWYEVPEYPSMYPWVTVQPLGTGTQMRLERNPYYWKVDAQGNQLPYIDSILGISYQDNESRTLAMLNGDLDFVKDPGNENRTLYYDALDEGKPLYINNPLSDGANVSSIHFNQTVSDTVKAEVFGSLDFRIGMSYAINRPEIIEIIFSGQGEPAQVAPVNDSPFYIEGMDTQYVEYDVDLANEHLDKILPDKDADGMRLGPDGNPLQIILTVQNDLGFGTFYVQMAELLIGYWKEVGVDVVLNSQPGPQYDENNKKNLIEATIYTGEGGAGITPLLDPRYYVPLWGGFVFDKAWAAWRTPDATGETVEVEPPQWAKDAYDKYEEVVAQPTLELQIALMREVLQEAKDRFYVIGIARPVPGYYPFHVRLHGIPDVWYDGWNEGVQKIMYPEQWFLLDE